MRLGGLIVAAAAAACFAGAAGAGTHAKAPCKAGQAGTTCTRAWMPAFPKGCSQFTSLVRSTLGLPGVTVSRKLAGHGAGNIDMECHYTPAGSKDSLVVDFVDRGQTPASISGATTGYMAGITGCVAASDADPSTETPTAAPRSIGIGTQSFAFAPCSSGWLVYGHNDVEPQYAATFVRVGATRWNVSGLSVPASELVALTRTLVAKYH